MKTLKLIEGEFSAGEFRELITNLYSNKIKFYERKNFSSLIRFGKKDMIALKQIEDLNQSYQQIMEIFISASTKNKKVTILSEIQITLSS